MFSKIETPFSELEMLTSDKVQTEQLIKAIPEQSYRYDHDFALYNHHKSVSFDHIITILLPEQ